VKNKARTPLVPAKAAAETYRATVLWMPACARMSGRGISPLILATYIIMAASPGVFSFSARADEPTARTEERAVEVIGKRQVRNIAVTLGKSETIRADRPFSNVVVGDPDIADAVPLSDRSLSVLAKKIGTTRVSAYVDGKTLVGVFDVDVTYDVGRISAELGSRFPGAKFRVASLNGRLMLSGSAPDAVTLDRALTIVRQFGPDVINSVRVSQPQQVMLEVRFIEASRTASRELGVKWNVVAKNFLANTGTAAALVSGNPPFGVLIGRLIGNGVEVDAMVNALEERGMARRLAEPNLVTLSGDTASFLAGGEIPIPVQGNLGQVTIEYKKYGVGLAFTPTVLERSLINLKIEPEVSQIDPNNVVQVSGIRVPGLIVRRANTTIELRDGQSFAIAGLLQSIGTTEQQQFPWLGDLPVLGALLRSAAYQKQETDLVIIVTPRLVQPTRPGDVVRTPLDNTAPPSDPDLFLLGRNELSPRQLREATSPGPVKAVGHILDLPGRTADVH
jgi:pilus assembly protein CpaC